MGDALPDERASAAVKVHDPSIVADWSSVKEIDGMYPGVIVAKTFCEEHGILTGVHNPTTIFVIFSRRDNTKTLSLRGSQKSRGNPTKRN